MAIFIDASLLCAYINKDDIHYKKAKKIVKDIVSGKYGKPIMSDYIFDESVAVTMRKASKKKAEKLGDLIINSEVVLVHISETVFERAWKIFKKRKKLSFTDCTNIAFMKTYDINKIATFDKEFNKVKGIETVSK